MFSLKHKLLNSNIYFNLTLSKKFIGDVHYVKSLYLPFSQTRYENIKDFSKGDTNFLSQIGLLNRHTSGYYTLLPFMYRICSKIIKLVERNMNDVGGQRIMMPSIYKIDLLETSDRYASFKNEIFTFNGQRDNIFYLAPTHEEPVVNLFRNRIILNRNQLPILLYQIDSKFRNEIRPRCGLLRSNQFLMKDMYSFDVDQNNAFKTYEKVCSAYNKIFETLEIDFIKVNANNGIMGGSFSHEFHMELKEGDDILYLCEKCKKNYNQEVLKSDKRCLDCNNDMKIKKAIELGHTFYLGTRYSSKFNFVYLDETLKEVPLEMCSYGIGITRLIAAILNKNSKYEYLKLPLCISPYHILIIPPKENSKEDINKNGEKISYHFAKIFAENGFDVLIDNRYNKTIGKRLYDCKIYGIPYILIIGKESISKIPKFDLISNEKTESLTHSEIIQKFENIISSNKI